MSKTMRLIPLIIFSLIIFTAMGAPVYGEDELVLTGVVKEINKAAGTAIIDVTSTYCYGERTFKIGRPDIAAKLSSAGSRVVRVTVREMSCDSASPLTIIGVYVKPFTMESDKKAGGK